jgi:hypothetical protein
MESHRTVRKHPLFPQKQSTHENILFPKILDNSCRMVQIMRDAIEQEAGEPAAGTEGSPEDQSSGVRELEESQAAFAAYVAS